MQGIVMDCLRLVPQAVKALTSISNALQRGWDIEVEIPPPYGPVTIKGTVKLRIPNIESVTKN